MGVPPAPTGNTWTTPLSKQMVTALECTPSMRVTNLLKFIKWMFTIFSQCSINRLHILAAFNFTTFSMQQMPLKMSYQHCHSTSGMATMTFVVPTPGKCQRKFVGTPAMGMHPWHISPRILLRNFVQRSHRGFNVALHQNLPPLHSPSNLSMGPSPTDEECEGYHSSGHSRGLWNSSWDTVP